MTGTFHCSVFVLLLASRSLGFAGPPCGEPGKPCPQISALVVDYVDVPSEKLGIAKREAARILGEAGIETVWVDCVLVSDAAQNHPACEERWSSTDVVLRILPPSQVPSWAHGAALVGHAVPARERGFATVANVFPHSVEELLAKMSAFSGGRMFSSAVILGHVIAHELGHLFLGANGHSGTGIMQFPWGRKILQLSTQGGLLFTRGQAKTMRTQVVRRLRTRTSLRKESRSIMPSEKAAAQSRSAAINLEAQGGMITALLYNYAEVPGRILEEAEQSAARVFRRAGIKITWRAGPLVPSEVEDEPSRVPRLYLRIVPQSMAARFPVARTCLGFTQSLVPPVASVFYHQVQRVVRRRRTLDAGVVLGHLMAHEMGHLLLGEEAHSHAGIMSIPWTLQHVRSAAKGQLLFTEQEAATMRADVERRTESENSH